MIPLSVYMLMDLSEKTSELYCNLWAFLQLEKARKKIEEACRCRWKVAARTMLSGGEITLFQIEGFPSCWVVRFHGS
jgi:hypothetical protein